MKDLRGRTAVVTGAGSGIGEGICLALADAGVQLVLADIRLASAQRVCALVRARGVDAIAVEVDVARRDAVSALADAAWARFGGVDILCNNAGVIWRPARTVLQATMADWQWMVGVNLWGVIHGIDVFLPRMVAQQRAAHIVNTSSILGLMPQGGYAPYSMTKAAITGLSEALAQELRPLGIGVTVLHPSAVRTSMATGEDLRPSSERSTAREIEGFVNPDVQAMYGSAIDPIEVGRMVRHAIEQEQVVLRTHAITPEDVARRMAFLYGPATLGQA